MAFSETELYRIKAELGYNTLTNGAVPYITINSLFDAVVNVYQVSEIATVSSSVVSSSRSPASASLTLTSATGFQAGQRVVIDVDSLTEKATIRSLTGSAISVLLAKAHSGTYPVAVEGPVTLARECLAEIDRIHDNMTRSRGTGSLKSADEISFYEGRGKTLFGNLLSELSYYRNRLASILGVENAWNHKGGGGSVSLSPY